MVTQVDVIQSQARINYQAQLSITIDAILGCYRAQVPGLPHSPLATS